MGEFIAFGPARRSFATLCGSRACSCSRGWLAC